MSSGGQVSNETDMAAYGKEIYKTHCALCHGERGNAKIAQSADLTITKMNTTEISDLIYHGKKTMPRFAEVLGEPEINAVSNYVLTLKALK